MGLLKILGDFFDTKKSREREVKLLVEEAEKEGSKGNYYKAVDYLDRARTICNEHNINGNLSLKIGSLDTAYRSSLNSNDSGHYDISGGIGVSGC